MQITSRLPLFISCSFSLIVSTIAIGCSAPIDESDGKTDYRVTNNLEERLINKQEDETSKSTNTSGLSPQQAERLSFEITEGIQPPNVNGTIARATSVTFDGNDNLYIGYLLLGSPFGGGIDILDAANPSQFNQVTSLKTSNTDVQALASPPNNDDIYVAEANRPLRADVSASRISVLSLDNSTLTKSSRRISGNVAKSVAIEHSGSQTGHDFHAIDDNNALFRFDRDLNENTTVKQTVAGGIDFSGIATHQNNVFILTTEGELYSSTWGSGASIQESSLTLTSGIERDGIGRLHAYDQNTGDNLQDERVFAALGAEGFAVLDENAGSIIFRQSKTGTFTSGGDSESGYYTDVALHGRVPAANNEDLIYASRRRGFVDVYAIADNGIGSGLQLVRRLYLEDAFEFAQPGTTNTPPSINRMLGVHGSNTVYMAGGKAGSVIANISTISQREPIDTAYFCSTDPNTIPKNISSYLLQKNNAGEVVEIGWNSTTQLSTVVLRSGLEMHNYSGGNRGTALSQNGEVPGVNQAPRSPCPQGENLVAEAEKFDDIGPPGPLAYADANDNKQYDSGETTYQKSELFEFDKDVRLVIPPDVGGGAISNSKIEMSAKKVTSQIDIESTSDKIEIETGTEGIDLSTTSVQSAQGLKLESAKGANLTEGTFVANGKMELKSNSNFAGTEAKITTNNDKIELEVEDGELNLEKATVDSGQDSNFEAAGKVILEKADLAAIEKMEIKSGRDLDATGSTMTTTNNKIELKAENSGSADLTDTSIDSGQGVKIESAASTTLADAAVSGKEKVKIKSGGPMTADGGEFTTDNNKIELKAENSSNMSLPNATISSGQGIKVEGTGEVTLTNSDVTATEKLKIKSSRDLDATGSTMTTTNNKIELKAENSGSAVLTDTSIDSGQGLNLTASGNANVSSSTLNAKEKIKIISSQQIKGSASNLTTQNNKLKIKAENAGAKFSDSTITSGAKLKIKSSATTVLSRSNVTSTDKLKVKAAKIKAVDVKTTSKNAKIELKSEGSGPIETAGAIMNADGSLLLQTSGSNIHLEDSTNQQASVTAAGDAQAKLGDSSATLFIDGLQFTDADNIFKYSPSDITIDGSLQTGVLQ